MKAKVCDRMVLEPSSYLSRISRIIFVEKKVAMWRNFSFLYWIWTIYGVLSKFMPFLFQIYVEKNLCGENMCEEKKWQIWGLSIDGMYSYFRPFQHFSFFAANIWSQECVYASSARRMRPIIAQLLSHCNSSKKMLRSTPYRSFKQIRSFNLLRKIDERHVDTEGSSIETIVKGEVESSVFFSNYTQTLMHPQS